MYVVKACLFNPSPCPSGLLLASTSLEPPHFVPDPSPIFALDRVQVCFEEGRLHTYQLLEGTSSRGTIRLLQ